MDNLDTRISNVINKSTLFIVINNILGENMTEIYTNILLFLNNESSSSSTKQNLITDFLIDFLGSKEIEVDENDCDSIANILVWVYDEYKEGKDNMYKKIVNIVTPIQCTIGEQVDSSSD